MLSSSPLVVFFFHLSMSLVINIGAAVVADSTHKEDSGSVTKGTMLYQSATKIFAAVQGCQSDDFELLDEFDSNSKAEAHAAGAHASKTQLEAYATGADALPALLQHLKTAQGAAPSAWYNASLHVASCHGWFGCLQDFFLVIAGAVGYCIWRGCPWPHRRLSSTRFANSVAPAAKETREAMPLDTVRMDELVQAMYLDNKEHLQKLLQERSADASEEVWGCTALHVAAHCGCASAAEGLLQRGANANLRDTWDETPLHFAARSGSTEVCQLLIACGADLNAVNACDWTPLVVAAHARKEAVCNLLFLSGATVGGLPDKELPPLLASLLARHIFEGHDQITYNADLKIH